MAASRSDASDPTAHKHADPRPVLTGTVQVIGPARWPRLMDRGTLAEYLSVSPRHVDALVKQGLIPPAKVRPSIRLVRWDRADVDAALDRASNLRSVPGRSFDEILAPALVGQTGITKSGGR